MLPYVPCPEFDDVPVGIGHVGGPTRVSVDPVAVEGLLVHLEPVAAKTVDGSLVVGVRQVQGVMDVHPSPPASDSDLRTPEPDPRALAGHHPDGLAALPALDHGQAESFRVEAHGFLEVDDLEDELVDAGDGDAVRHTSLGEGIVTRIEPGGIVTVRFADDGAERRLMLEYAPLERIA